MKRIVFAFFAAVLLAIAPIQAQTSKTLIVQPKTGEFAGRTFYTNSHALIVGIGTYKFLPKDKQLKFAANDARDLREVLIRSYGFAPENVTLLLDEQATKANIEAALSRLANRRQVGSNDRILVFFSGHGQTVKSAFGGEIGFLIPNDANVDLDDPENQGPYLASCLPMNSVWDYLQGSPAKHALLLADACYGGLLAQSRALNNETLKVPVVAKLLARPARQVMTAGSSGEEAFELPELGHGAFTSKLLEELKAEAEVADDVILASSLASRLKISVPNITAAKQLPQFGNYGGTEGEFVFVTTLPQFVPPLESLPVPQPQPSPVIPLLPVPPTPITRTPQRGDTKINQIDGAEMVWIPAGEFTMGSKDVEDNPVRKVNVAGFWMYKMEVTVRQYRKFCNAKRGGQMPEEPEWGWQDNYPVVNVSWNDAQAYCAWAGVRLPSEQEWEKAARGDDGREYPWGNELDDNLTIAQTTKPAPVGSKPNGMSPYGCLDMAGNVYEWCEDLYDNEDVTRVRRGGAWNKLSDWGSAVSRDYCDPVARIDNSGFRCASGP